MEKVETYREFLLVVAIIALGVLFGEIAFAFFNVLMELIVI